jgi:hypothetical protein
MHPVRARSRALRVAQLVCGLSVTACSSAPTGSDAGTDAGSSADAVSPTDAASPSDAALDAGEDDEEHHDAYVDGNFAGDAGCRELIPTDRVCCELGGGQWYTYDGGFAECFVAVPGPFVPPSEGQFS